jgi:hypothetical protein
MCGVASLAIVAVSKKICLQIKDADVKHLTAARSRRRIRIGTKDRVPVLAWLEEKEI